MSRVIVIGATGHIGTYLVPRLVRGGHEVTAVSRGAANRIIRIRSGTRSRGSRPIVMRRMPRGRSGPGSRRCGLMWSST